MYANWEVKSCYKSEFEYILQAGDDVDFVHKYRAVSLLERNILNH